MPKPGRLQNSKLCFSRVEEELAEVRGGLEKVGLVHQATPHMLAGVSQEVRTGFRRA